MKIKDAVQLIVQNAYVFKAYGEDHLTSLGLHHAFFAWDDFQHMDMYAEAARAVLKIPTLGGTGRTWAAETLLASFDTPRGRWVALVVFGPDTSLGLVQLFFEQLVEDLAAAAPAT